MNEAFDDDDDDSLGYVNDHLGSLTLFNTL